ncbi:MAG: alpha/beta-type small acid-soluble spore protein [Lachnospiraceae bacterium]|nr:alpha/beta-type small acid-soluble spore protein [Lachnospiraceae bacterium]
MEVAIMSSKYSKSEAMNRFKMECASEVGVDLKQGYNGDLTSRQNGSVGGQMTKKLVEAQMKAISGK